MGKKVLITGGTGYVGRNLVVSLAKKGHQIYVLTRKETSIFSDFENVQLLLGDVTTPLTLPEGIETIYHCAGVIYEKDLIDKVNVEGVRNIVNIAIQNKCRLIYLSSAGVTGKTNELLITEETPCKPENEYELSKYKAEQLVIEGIKNGLQACILRPSTIFGAGKSNLSKDTFYQLAKAMRIGLYQNIGKGILNIVHVDEVVKALTVLDEANLVSGEIFILNNIITYKDMNSIVKHLTPRVNKQAWSLPHPVAWLAAVVLGVVYFIINKRNPLTFSRLRALTNERIYSQNKILKKTAFKNTKSLEDYIAEICNEYIKLGLLP